MIALPFDAKVYWPGENLQSHKDRQQQKRDLTVSNCQKLYFGPEKYVLKISLGQLSYPQNFTKIGEEIGFNGL